MNSLLIDLDAEAIQYEGQWYTRDELARKIKGMLDAGDFAIGKPSQALEQLNQTLASLRTLAFRVTPEMADAINQISARHNRGVGSIIREALTMHLGLPPSADAERPPAKRPPSPTGRRQTEPELPAVLVPATAAAPALSPPIPPLLVPAVPAVPLEPKPPPLAAPAAVLAGPGALKAGAPNTPPPYPIPPHLNPAPQGLPSVMVDKAVLPDVPAVPPAEPAAKKADDAAERRWFGE